MDIDEIVSLSRSTVRIRRSEVGDAVRVLDAVRASVTELERWMPWAHAGYSIADTSTWLDLCRDGNERVLRPFLPALAAEIQPC